VAQSPFDSIESAHEYEQFLLEALTEARAHIRDELTAAQAGRLDRRLQALRLVDYKLAQLGEHLAASSRLLNDLRTLRRLLLRERAEDPGSA
jgi:hypothetical protein